MVHHQVLPGSLAGRLEFQALCLKRMLDLWQHHLAPYGFGSSGLGR
jgi:hypothetical protein